MASKSLYRTNTYFACAQDRYCVGSAALRPTVHRSPEARRPYAVKLTEQGVESPCTLLGVVFRLGVVSVLFAARKVEIQFRADRFFYLRRGKFVALRLQPPMSSIP